MGAITTCITNQCKLDLMQGGVLFALSNVQTGNTTTGTCLVNTLTNTAVLTVGMTVSGPGLNAGAANTSTVSRIINSSAIAISEITASTTGGSYTFTGDTYNVALIKFTPAGTYDRNTAAFANVQADEATGAGYTANGVALVPIAPGAGRGVDIIDSNTACVNFSNPSWTTATLNVAGMVIYSRGIINATPSTPQQRVGYTASGASVNSLTIGLAGVGTTTAMHTVSLHDFGGQQVVTAGTFTVNMPTANGTAAILRIG